MCWAFAFSKQIDHFYISNWPPNESWWQGYIIMMTGVYNHDDRGMLDGCHGKKSVVITFVEFCQVLHTIRRDILSSILYSCRLTNSIFSDNCAYIITFIYVIKCFIATLKSWNTFFAFNSNLLKPLLLVFLSATASQINFNDFVMRFNETEAILCCHCDNWI